MAVAPVLVVSFVFDPPQIAVVGQLQESTIAKLNDILPNLASINCHGRRKVEQFQVSESPLKHWTVQFRTLVTEEPARIAIMLAVLDALDNEGGWTMRDSTGITHDDEEEYHMFFTKKNI